MYINYLIKKEMTEKELLLEIDTHLNKLNDLSNQDYFNGYLFNATIWKIYDNVKKLIEEHKVDYAKIEMLKNLQNTINATAIHVESSSQMNKRNAKKRAIKDYHTSLSDVAYEVKMGIYDISQKIKEIERERTRLFYLPMK